MNLFRCVILVGIFCLSANAQASLLSLVGSEWQWGGTSDRKLTFTNLGECFISEMPIEQHSWHIISDDTIEIESEDSPKRIYRITFNGSLKKGEITLFNKKKDSFLSYSIVKRLQKRTEQDAAANP